MTDAPASTRRDTLVLERDGFDREELRGRAAGVAVCAVMGLAWTASALGDLGSGVAVAVLAAGVAAAAVLLAGVRRLRRADARPTAPSSSFDPSQVRRRFNLVVAGEIAVIAAAANILGRTGHSRWIPAVICAAVGLHFVPLARLFGLGLYYATAVALCLVAALTMFLGATGASESLWRLLPGLGTALVLWATGARLLATTPTGSKVRP
ncbi:MAG: hypothetical protein QOG82_1704 [Actinomycetota bacterium]|jgi:hypothetical protein|nr:hypothetical protein [Actinomycetota bacterium]